MAECHKYHKEISWKSLSIQLLFLPVEELTYWNKRLKGAFYKIIIIMKFWTDKERQNTLSLFRKHFLPNISVRLNSWPNIIRKSKKYYDIKP